MSFRILCLLFPLFLMSCSKAGREVKTYEIPKTSTSSMAPAVATVRAEEAALQWDTPKGWSERGASDMRLASFQMPGNGDGSIVSLGGDAGGLVANVNRWRGQAGLAPASEAEIEKSALPIETALGTFHFYEINPAKGKNGILAAVAFLSDKTIFIKLTGESKTLHAEKNNFLSLVKTLRNSNAK